MIAATLALFLVGQTAPANDAASVHAERCHGHVIRLIEEAAAEGPVAGPSWFIRDWWEQRLPQTSTPETRAAVREVLLAEEDADLAAFATERTVCIEEAIEGGAVPGWGAD